MLINLCNNAFLAQGNPSPSKKKTSEPWKRLARALPPSGPSNINAFDPLIPRNPISHPNDVFGPAASSSQPSTSLSQLHRAFSIGPVPPPYSQSSNSTILSQVQRRFGIRNSTTVERQLAVTPFQIDVESPSPTTVREAARSEARQRNVLLLASPSRRRYPSPSPEPRRQLAANLDGGREWDDIDNLADLHVPGDDPVCPVNLFVFYANINRRHLRMSGVQTTTMRLMRNLGLHRRGYAPLRQFPHSLQIYATYSLGAISPASTVPRSIGITRRGRPVL